MGAAYVPEAYPGAGGE
jgi:hypothetical protein